MQFDDLSHALAGIRPGGSVHPYVDDFAAQLLASRYTILSTRDFVRSATHFGRWMDSCEIGLESLTQTCVFR